MKPNCTGGRATGSLHRSPEMRMRRCRVDAVISPAHCSVPAAPAIGIACGSCRRRSAPGSPSPLAHALRARRDSWGVQARSFQAPGTRSASQRPAVVVLCSFGRPILDRYSISDPGPQDSLTEPLRRGDGRAGTLPFRACFGPLGRFELMMGARLHGAQRQGLSCKIRPPTRLWWGRL